MDQNYIKILLVEDDDIDAEEIERNFKKLKLINPLIRARDGLEALEMLQKKDPRISHPLIVLLDLNMPRMSGLEFLREIRKDSNFTKLPVFVLTSSDDKGDIDKAYQEHVSGYLVKPVKKGELDNMLQQLDAYWALIKIPEAIKN